MAGNTLPTLPFVAGDGVDGERMYIGLQHVAHGRIHRAVAGQYRHAVEVRTDDRDAEMPQAALGAGMANVLVAVIIHIQRLGCKSLFKPLADLLNARNRHYGSTLTNGLTSTYSYTSATT